MPRLNPRRALLARLLLPCALGVTLAVAASLWLDGSAERAAQVERIRLWARVAAQVAAQTATPPATQAMSRGPGGSPAAAHSGGLGGLGALLSAVVRTDPDVAAVRVEGADGRSLGQAGDSARAQAWEDRTFALASGPVRVRLGYRLGAQPLALAVRAAFWALLMGSVLAVVVVTVAWSLRER